MEPKWRYHLRRFWRHQKAWWRRHWRGAAVLVIGVAVLVITLLALGMAVRVDHRSSPEADSHDETVNVTIPDVTATLPPGCRRGSAKVVTLNGTTVDIKLPGALLKQLTPHETGWLTEAEATAVAAFVAVLAVVGAWVGIRMQIAATDRQKRIDRLWEEYEGIDAEFATSGGVSARSGTALATALLSAQRENEVRLADNISTLQTRIMEVARGQKLSQPASTATRQT
jgi:hypothetical protein